MDEGQLRQGYQVIKQAIVESSRAPSEILTINKLEVFNRSQPEIDVESVKSRSLTTSVAASSQVYIKELEQKLERERQEREKIERELREVRSQSESMS